MDLRWPRVARQSNVGLVTRETIRQRFSLVTSSRVKISTESPHSWRKNETQTCIYIQRYTCAHTRVSLCIYPHIYADYLAYTGLLSRTSQVTIETHVWIQPKTLVSTKYNTAWNPFPSRPMWCYIYTVYIHSIYRYIYIYIYIYCYLSITGSVFNQSDKGYRIFIGLCYTYIVSKIMQDICRSVVQVIFCQFHGQFRC